MIGLPAMLLGRVWKSFPGAVTIGACVAVFVIGAARYEASVSPPGPDAISALNDRGVAEVQGWISAEPEMRDRTSHLRLDVSAIRLDGQWRPASGTVLMIMPRYPSHDYGEELIVLGKLEAPKPLDGFDYPGHLARQGVRSTMLFPKVEVLRQGRGLGAWGWLLGVKALLGDGLSRVLPDPEASLAQGMLLGVRSAIPEDVMESFTRSGTAHIIVISGQNLTLLAGYLLRTSQFVVGRRRGLWIALVGIVAYTLLVGAQPPVVRAAIMSSMFILGTSLGRQKEAAIGLAFSAAVMTAIHPSILWDVSFQLSFAATAGLIFITPTVQRGIERLRPLPATWGGSMAGRIHLYIVENLAVTLAATVAVLPLLLANFHRLSLIAPASNILLLPALPGVMFSGALAAGLGLVPGAGQLAGWVAWPFLKYMTFMVDILGRVPLASMEVPGFETGLAVLYYSVLCLALIWRPRAGEPSRR